jgi:hypothetical protein
MKTGFGGGMRPINQAFIEPKIPGQSNPAWIKREVFGGKVCRPLDRREGIQG